MCPDCTRGLTQPQREVCVTCRGTGFYTSESIKLDIPEVPEPKAVKIEVKKVPSKK